MFSIPIEARDTQPNILLIVADNQPASILGAYGNPDVRTPNIDRIADEGLRFTHAFAVHGMCSPTRATLLTGLLPSQHGVQDWLYDEEMAHWPSDWNDMQEDPGQGKNLYGNAEHAEAVSDLDRRLTRFFDTYRNPEYDLWRGRTVKGATETIQVYKSLYGKQWKPEPKIRPAFKEPKEEQGVRN